MSASLAAGSTHTSSVVICSSTAEPDTVVLCSAIPEPELLKGIVEAITPQNATFVWKLTVRDQELLRNLSLTLPPHVRCHSPACGCSAVQPCLQ